MKKEVLKHHKALLNIIAQFKKSKSGTLISSTEEFNGRKVRFNSFKKQFKISLQFNNYSKKIKYIKVGEYYKGIQIKFGHSIYSFEDLYIRTLAPPKMYGYVDKISTKDFSEDIKYYYNLIIPLESELDFYYIIEQTTFTTDLGYRSRSGTSATINEESIEICCIHNDKNKYFIVIDSHFKQTFKDFVKKANSILVGLGYLTGYYAGFQRFYFAYSNRVKIHPKHFCCDTSRDTIKSGYHPIYANAYIYIDDIDLAKQYYTILRTVSIEEFSILCNKIYNSHVFSSMLMLILESSVTSLLFMPAGYAIAMETISDLIIGNKKLKLAPIKDKKVGREIRKKFNDVLEKYNSISKSDLKLLRSRIEQLNQISNRSRLQAPFDILKINLVEEDIKVLETRNDFLHGRVPDLLNEGKIRSEERISKDLYYCSIRFYTLLNLIIMKLIGYDNRVVNYAKIHENFTKIKLKEEPFRQI